MLNIVITRYSITTANDHPERDPISWTLSGSNDGTSWVQLDTRSGEVFSGRMLTSQYYLPNAKSFTYYRLSIKNQTSPLQFAGWSLYTAVDHDVSPATISLSSSAPGTQSIPAVTVL